MPHTQTDYLSTFKRDFLGCLAKPLDPKGAEDQAAIIISKAESQGIAYFAKIFDSMRISVGDKATLQQSIDASGGLEQYMQNIIDEMAKVLLTSDKSRLNDTVIQAMSVDKYAKILKGKVVDGVAVASSPDAENAFADDEQKVAYNFLSAIISNFSQSMSSDAEYGSVIQKIQPGMDALEKNKGHLHQRIVDLGGTLVSHFNIVSQGASDFHAEAHNKSLIELAEQTEKTLADETIGLEVLMQLDKAREEQKGVGRDHIDGCIKQYQKEWQTPLETLRDRCKVNGSVLASAVEQSPEDEIEALYKTINVFLLFLSDLENDKELSTADKEALIKSIKTCQNKLSNAIDYYNEAKWDPSNIGVYLNNMKLNLKDGTNDLLTKINPETLTVKPSKPLMNLFFRIIRAMWVWKLISDDEVAELNRPREQSNLVSHLISEKKRQAAISPEKESWTVTKMGIDTDEANSMSIDSGPSSLCSTPSMGESMDRSARQPSPSGVDEICDEDTFKSMYEGSTPKASMMFFTPTAEVESGTGLESDQDKKARLETEEAWTGVTSTRQC